jgi:hypothetical protein
MPIPALAEVQLAPQEAATWVKGDRGEHCRGVLDSQVKRHRRASEASP